MMEQYRGRDLGELSPHVYAIADAAYRQMRSEAKSQSILVSVSHDRTFMGLYGLFVKGMALDLVWEARHLTLY